MRNEHFYFGKIVRWFDCQHLIDGMGLRWQTYVAYIVGGIKSEHGTFPRRLGGKSNAYLGRKLILWLGVEVVGSRKKGKTPSGERAVWPQIIYQHNEKIAMPSKPTSQVFLALHRLSFFLCLGSPEYQTLLARGFPAEPRSSYRKDYRNLRYRQGPFWSPGDDTSCWICHFSKAAMDIYNLGSIMKTL